MKKIVFSRKRRGFSRAFTLVELVIVLAILSVLAIFGFMSYQGYTLVSRDASRLQSVKNIENGIDIFYAMTETVPLPDEQIGTGKLNGVELNQVGYIGNMIALQIKLNAIPHDPLTQSSFMYGVDVLHRYYQVGVAYEGDVAYDDSIFPDVYAEKKGGRRFEVRVKGSYNYPLYIEGKMYTLPSLIYLGDDELTDETKFVIDRGENLPIGYVGNAGSEDGQSVEKSLQQITGKPGLSLTGIDMPLLTREEFDNSAETDERFKTLLQASGMDRKQLGKAMFGEWYTGLDTAIKDEYQLLCDVRPNYKGATFVDGEATEQNQAWQTEDDTKPCYWTCGTGMVLSNYTCVSTSCTGTIPDGIKKVSNATAFLGMSWHYATTPGACTYKCGDGFHTENNSTCIANVRDCLISNGTGSQTWNGSRSACVGVSCNINYRLDENKTCVLDCGGRPFKEGSGPVCGTCLAPAQGSGPVCGSCKMYNSRVSNLCTCVSYNSGTSCRWCGGNTGYCRTCQHYNFGCRRYSSCRRSEFGCAQRPSCTHSSFGCGTRSTCRHPSFGCEE